MGKDADAQRYVIIPELAGTFAEDQAINRIVFEDNLIRVGLWRCRPWHTQFREDNQAAGHYIVFPHSSVSITPVGSNPVVADPNVVMFYNRHQGYQREKLSDRGDICNYFGFNPEAIIETARLYQPHAIERPEHPFTLTHGPSDSQTFLLQRLLVAYVLNEAPPDPLYIQEMSLYLLARVLRKALPHTFEQPATGNRAHAELAYAAQKILSTHYSDSLTLDDLAARLYTSPYHLCRIFSLEVGQTIHQYRNQLRLRVGVDQVLGTAEDLTSIGLDLGYSSHSHFTSAFRRLFGLTPSQLRQNPSSQQIKRLRKNLTV